MQSLPLALILCSSAVMALDVSEIIGYVETASIANIPSTSSVVASGATTQTLSEVGKITVNGKEYTVRADANVAANGNLDFQNFQNFKAEGAVASDGKIVIDGLGTVAFFVGANGRMQYVNNVLSAEGALDVNASEGANKIRLAANGALVCNSQKLTCDKVTGSYDVSIVSQWLNYNGAGSVNGAASIANGNVVLSGQVSAGEGSWQYVNRELVWVPANGSATSKGATSTATKKPTNTPTNDATTMGASALAAVAGIFSFFF